MRWLYHVTAEAPHEVRAGAEGFVHCSFQPDVRESARIHFPAAADLCATRIDPRRVDGLRVEATPRGLMPHVYGDVPRDAIVQTIALEAIDQAPDHTSGTRFAIVGFERMTLLDLVGVFDPLSRIASMGIDRDATVETISATEGAWGSHGARFVVAAVRPKLDAFDVLVVAGGPETRTLEHDAAVIAWLQTFPANRLTASVCTGALLLGAAGRLRGKRATTHHASLDTLARYGATAVPRERVVRDGQLFTAGGVTAALDLGLTLAAHLYGDEARARIAARMEYPRAP